MLDNKMNRYDTLKKKLKKNKKVFFNQYFKLSSYLYKGQFLYSLTCRKHFCTRLELFQYPTLTLKILIMCKHVLWSPMLI